MLQSYLMDVGRTMVRRGGSPAIPPSLFSEVLKQGGRDALVILFRSDLQCRRVLPKVRGSQFESQ